MKKINVLMADLKSELASSPYQLGLLAAYALAEAEVAKNVKITFSSHPQKQPAEKIAETILAVEADLVAMSNYAWNYKKMCQLLDTLSRTGTRLPRIVLGGPNCAGRFGANMLRQYPIVSAIVEGEGEPAFRDICAALIDSPTKDPFLTARNCRIRDQAGEIIQLNMGHRIMYLDEVPSPYLTGLLPVNQPPVFYETNRGCPYRCAFCYWGNGNSKIYRMSHERVREEMTFFAMHRVSALAIADANFGVFETDTEIVEMMAELNARFDYPFKYLAVNYAKHSSDRVLEIASILRQSKIYTTTTLALQSVTPEAEKRSRRYAIATSKYVNLVRSADKKDIPTYTDLILGLPGESIEEFLIGLEAVISTGVPAIKIFQLSLLPGTEFYDQQEKHGLVLMSEADVTTVPADKRSEYWDFLVNSHPKMNQEDMKRGLRLIGINHLLHNHNLGKVVNFYLARYGIMHRQVYDFFDDLLLGQVVDFPEEQDGFLSRIRDLILTFAQSGIDSFAFERELSVLVWFGGKGIRSDSNEPEVRSFMHNFYRAFCRRQDICQTPQEVVLLTEFIDYNVLLSPKPRWRPKPQYLFEYDVHAIWQDMLAQILIPSEEKAGNTETWQDLSRNVSFRLTELLSNRYLEQKRGPVAYKVENPILTRKLIVFWMQGNREWFCRISKIDN